MTFLATIGVVREPVRGGNEASDFHRLGRSRPTAWQGERPDHLRSEPLSPNPASTTWSGRAPGECDSRRFEGRRLDRARSNSPAANSTSGPRRPTLREFVMNILVAEDQADVGVLSSESSWSGWATMSQSPPTATWRGRSGQRSRASPLCSPTGSCPASMAPIFAGRSASARASRIAYLILLTCQEGPGGPPGRPPRRGRRLPRQAPRRPRSWPSDWRLPAGSSGGPGGAGASQRPARPASPLRRVDRRQEPAEVSARRSISTTRSRP